MTKADWPLYVAPMAAFLVLTSLESALPRTFYPYLYAVKVLLIAALTLLCRRKWRSELRWESKPIVLGALVGLVGLGLWLGLDHLQPDSWSLGKRVGFNPFEAIESVPLRTAFLAFRFVGLAVLVPVVEEVFWRSFLLRFLTDQEKWVSLSVGTFSTTAFVAVAAAFSLSHPEWLAALGYALLIGGLLRYTKSLAACVTAHAVTNAALGVFVLMTGNWKYW